MNRNRLITWIVTAMIGFSSFAQAASDPRGYDISKVTKKDDTTEMTATLRYCEEIYPNKGYAEAKREIEHSMYRFLARTDLDHKDFHTYYSRMQQIFYDQVAREHPKDNQQLREKCKIDLSLKDTFVTFYENMWKNLDTYKRNMDATAKKYGKDRPIDTAEKPRCSDSADAYQERYYVSGKTSDLACFMEATQRELTYAIRP